MLLVKMTCERMLIMFEAGWLIGTYAFSHALVCKFGIFHDLFIFIDCTRSDFKHQKGGLWGEKTKRTSIECLLVF